MNRNRGSIVKTGDCMKMSVCLANLGVVIRVSSIGTNQKLIK